MAAPVFAAPPLPTMPISRQSVEFTVPAKAGDVTRVQVYARPAGGTFNQIFDSDARPELILPRPQTYGIPNMNATIGYFVYEFKTVVSNADGSTESEVVQETSLGPTPPIQVLGWDSGSTTVTLMVILPAWNANTVPPNGGTGYPPVRDWLLFGNAPFQPPPTPSLYGGNESSGFLVRTFVINTGANYIFTVTYKDSYSLEDHSSCQYYAGDPPPKVGPAGDDCGAGASCGG